MNFSLAVPSSMILSSWKRYPSRILFLECAWKLISILDHSGTTAAVYCIYYQHLTFIIYILKVWADSHGQILLANQDRRSSKNSPQKSPTNRKTSVGFLWFIVAFVFFAHCLLTQWVIFFFYFFVLQILANLWKMVYKV